MDGNAVRRSKSRSDHTFATQGVSRGPNVRAATLQKKVVSGGHDGVGKGRV
jgi:hypothetical protein